MALPITTPLDVSPEDLFQRFVDRMQTEIPGWEPADGSPDVWMAEAFSEIAADAAEGAADVLTDVFRWYGANVAGIAPVEAVSATSTVTITAVDNAGYTIDAGTNLAITATDGSLVGFELSEDAVIPALSTSVAGVQIIASDEVEGEDGNDLSGDVQMVDSLAYVDSVTLDAATSGGSDAESDDDYLDRLVAEERLRTVAPILARDFAQLAKRVQEVDRAAYLDGYNTANGTSGNALMITLTPVQDDGSNVSSGGKQAVIDQFAEEGDTPALVGFVVNVADPYRSGVSVLFTAVAEDGFDPDDVKAQAEAAVADYLDPQDWGQPTSGEERRFNVENMVRIGKLYRVLYDVEGLFQVTSLTVGLEGFADDFSTNTIANYTFTVGAGTIAVSGGQLVPSTTATKRFYRSVGGFDNTGNYYDFQSTMKIIYGAAISGDTRLGKRIDSNNRVYVILANGSLVIRTTIAAAESGNLGTTATPALAAGNTRWLRFRIEGNVVTGELWTSAPSATGTPANTVTATLTGTAATLFGAGVKGGAYVEMGSPGTDYRYDDLVVAGVQASADLLLPTSQASPVPMPAAATITGTVT